MQPRRIGNGKGVEAIENVIEVINEATEYANVHFNMNHVSVVQARKGVKMMKQSFRTAQRFIDDVANGKIDDGDVMDYIIENKDYKFMDNVEKVIKAHRKQAEHYGKIVVMDKIEKDEYNMF